MLAALCVAALLPAEAGAATFIVNSTLDVQEASPGNGQCNPVGGVGATCTLRAAIQEANALGGTHAIAVPSGTYSITRTGTGEDAGSTGDFDITADITLVNGTNDPPLVTAVGRDRVFDVHTGGSLTVHNLHVHGGLANSPGNVHGGGIRVAAGATLRLEEAIVSTNIGNIGGGIYSDGIVEIIDSELFNNALLEDNVQAQFVDGTAVLNRGQLSIERSTFRDNGVVPGGENLAQARYVIASRVGFAASPSVTLTNSTLANNTNGIYSDAVPTEIVHGTITGHPGRGLRFLRDLGALGEVQLRVHRTAIVENGQDCNGFVGTELEYDLLNRANASSDDTCGFTGGSDIEVAGNALFGVLDLHGGLTPVMLPNPFGPLVDAAGMLCVPFEDQRGLARPIDGNLDEVNECDIGAVEYDPANDPLPETLLFSDGFES
jgi:CSLREA domain-containing protein